MAKRNGQQPEARLEVTPASEWEQTELVRLPSGKVAELRRPDVIDLIAGDGEAPDLLTGLVLEGMQGKARNIEINAQTFPQMLRAMNHVVKAAFVYPRLVEGEPQADGEVSVARVSFGDKSFVFSWALGVQYEQAESFRPEPAGNVATVPTVQDVPASAEPAVRNPE